MCVWERLEGEKISMRSSAELQNDVYLSAPLWTRHLSDWSYLSGLGHLLFVVRQISSLVAAFGLLLVSHPQWRAKECLAPWYSAVIFVKRYQELEVSLILITNVGIDIIPLLFFLPTDSAGGGVMY